jgi:hypothetical protein
MKKYVILLSVGIIISVTAIEATDSVSDKAAGKTDPILNGRWEGSAPVVEHRLEDGVYEEFYDGILQVKGNYTTVNGELTINITHMRNMGLTNLFSNGWGNYLTWEEDMVSVSQARAELINQRIGREIGWGGRADTPELRAESERIFEDTFGWAFRPKEYSRYFVRGDTLFLRHKWGITQWHRR